MLHQSSLGAAFLVLAAIGCCAATAFAAAPEPERRETVVDNIPVVYVDAGPRDGEALVFIHGWASNLTFWQAQMDAFQGRYRCIAIDMPGFGRSGKPQDIDYDLDLYARAIAAAVDDAGVTNPVLIGHSMGFAMARQFLVRYPGVARAVVNVDGTYFPVPPTEEGRAEWEKNTQGLAQSFAGPGRDDMMKQFTEWVFMGKTREDVRAVVRPVMLAVDPYVMTNSMIEFVDPKWWEPLHFDVP
ncbi:MAG: alpha/beta hydrolase, partial [Planctomycetes bacterium]|nr:alpha/beta hydrolase [Planctomycetota bacterium]